jgi:hypothetical protein
MQTNWRTRRQARLMSQRYYNLIRVTVTHPLFFVVMSLWAVRSGVQPTVKLHLKSVGFPIGQMIGHLPLSFHMASLSLTLVLPQWVHPHMVPLVQPSSPMNTPDGDLVHQYTDSILTFLMKTPGRICSGC